MAGGKIPPLSASITAFVIGQSKGSVTGDGGIPIRTVRSFPTYASHLPEFKVIKQRQAMVDGRPVKIVIKAVPPENILVEATTTTADVFGAETLDLKDRLVLAAEHELMRQDVEPAFREEYTLYCAKDYQGDPKKFLVLGDRIAALIKSENVHLSQPEIEKTILEGSLQYAIDDLTIVDWDGAFIFDQHGGWQDTIDILEVANINLLRLRHLDQQLDQRLDAMSGLLDRAPKISGRM